MTAIGVVASGAGGGEDLRARLVEPLPDRGFQVAVTLTPTAATWLEAIDELSHIERRATFPCGFNRECPNNIANTPMIVFPRVNAAHARQPAWNEHIERLRRVVFS